MTRKPRLLVHTSRQSRRWGERDAPGHVSARVHFRHFEPARVEAIVALRQAQGDRFESMGSTGSGTMIAAASPRCRANGSNTPGPGR